MDEQLRQLQDRLKWEIDEIDKEIDYIQSSISSGVDSIRYLELKRKALLGQVIPKEAHQ